MDIRIEIGNWQYNSGIVGLYNILEYAKKGSVILENNSMTFDSSELENFEEKYFNYLIKVYEKTLSWYKIVSFQERVDFFKKKSVLDINDLDEINKYVKDVLKKRLSDSRYKEAYEFIQGNIDPIQEEKELKAIALKKKEKIEDKLKDIQQLLEKIEKIIEYFNLESAKKQICTREIVNLIIKNGWTEVSFLNKKTRGKDVYKDFKKYLLISLDEYLRKYNDKYRYSCFVCERKIKNIEYNFNFLFKTGIDMNKKSSHVWNFTNDMSMCPICKLVYACLPVGFTYIYIERDYLLTLILILMS